MTESPPNLASLRTTGVPDVSSMAEKSQLTQSVSCPLCLHLKSRIIAQHRGKQLRQCPRCGGSHLFPQPTQAQISEHFESPPAESERELEQNFERNRAAVLAKVAAYIHRTVPSGAILDVGCATGLFLSKYFNGQNWRGLGVELSPRKAQRAMRRGVDVFVGDIHHAGFAANSFDIVTVLDAFYYFAHPDSELGEFRRILKNEGMLLLELPWANTRLWRQTGWLGRLLSDRTTPLLENSDHLFYYTPTSITELLERLGFHVDRIAPLAGNRQEKTVRDLLWRTYSALSQVVNFVSGASICLGPRFLVVARKCERGLNSTSRH